MFVGWLAGSSLRSLVPPSVCPCVCFILKKMFVWFGAKRAFPKGSYYLLQFTCRHGSQWPPRAPSSALGKRTSDLGKHSSSGSSGDKGHCWESEGFSVGGESGFP